MMGTLLPSLDAVRNGKRRLRAAALALLPLLLAAPVRGETLITGFAGVAFSGDAGKTPGSYGGALGFLGTGAFGFELEFGTTPQFFGPASGHVFTDNNVLNLMGSLLLATPPGPLRLYGALGAGLLKTRLDDPDRLLSIDSNDFGISAGGGLIVSLGDHFGLRGDARYFRTLQDPDPDGKFDIDLGNLDYWRVVGGITLKF